MFWKTRKKPQPSKPSKPSKTTPDVPTPKVAKRPFPPSEEELAKMTLVDLKAYMKQEFGDLFCEENSLKPGDTLLMHIPGPPTTQRKKK